MDCEIGSNGDKFVVFGVETSLKADVLAVAEEESVLLDWLSSLNFTARHSEIMHQMSPDTGSWILQSEEFNLWLSTEEKALWCPGMRRSIT